MSCGPTCTPSFFDSSTAGSICQAAATQYGATMRAASSLRAALCAAVVTLWLPTARAEDAAPAKTGVATPSVEELALPSDEKAQKPDNAGRETDTREAMCLMIESAAKSQDLPLEFFARVIWQENRFP